MQCESYCQIIFRTSVFQGPVNSIPFSSTRQVEHLLMTQTYRTILNSVIHAAVECTGVNGEALTLHTGYKKPHFVLQSLMRISSCRSDSTIPIRLMVYEYSWFMNTHDIPVSYHIHTKCLVMHMHTYCTSVKFSNIPTFTSLVLV